MAWWIEMSGLSFESCRSRSKSVVKESAQSWPRANVQCYLTMQPYSLYLPKFFLSFRSTVSHP